MAVCVGVIVDAPGPRVPSFDGIFIEGDDALEARCRHRVLVLRDPRSGAELDWLFDMRRQVGWLTTCL